jgi:hypothetical protein
MAPLFTDLNNQFVVTVFIIARKHDKVASLDQKGSDDMPDGTEEGAGP